MRLLFLSAVVTCACSDPGVIAARQVPAALQGDVAAIAAANNQFAIDVLRQQPAGNSIFSPFSLSTALAMLDAGAAGQTDAELRAALHFTLPAEQTNSAYGALLTSLDTGRRYGGYTLATGNRLFGQLGFPFEADFLSTTKTDYHAELMPVDFSGAPEQARTTINAWVANQTDDKIPELFLQGSINTGTCLVLANAITFDGDWAIPFDPSDTTNESFHIAGGGSVTVPMMHQERLLSVAPITGGRIGILPFEGEDLALLVFLPNDPDGLAQLEAQLTADTLAAALAHAQTFGEPVPIALPRFALTQSQDLPGLLQSLGITSAFSQAADFSGIDGARDLSVQSAFHRATITVDEPGASAAAATAVGVHVVVAPPPFRVVQSFAFAVFDNVTGSILFFGRVQDPTQP